jgi:hypothetical protein
MAPYFTCVDQRSALIALVDRQHAALFRYDNGVVTSLESWATSPPAHTGSDLHTSAPPRQGFGRGTGGLPGADVAAREAETAADRHLAHVVNRIRALDRPAGWLVLLGAAEFVSHVASALEREMAGRLAVAGRLPAGATAGEVRAAAAPAIAHLRCERTERLVADMLDHAHTPLSASGYTAVEHALADGAVRVLALAERWLRDDAAAAEDLLRRALSCGADVAFVSGEAGAQFEEAAGGIAAELRFPATVPAVAVS